MSAVTAPFSLQTITTRVWCDLENKDTGERLYDGFWIDVRRNLTNGERDALIEAVRAVDEDGTALTEQRRIESEAYRAALEAMGDTPDPARSRELIVAEGKALDQFIEDVAGILERRFALVAPFIHGWNLYDFTNPDQPVAVPAPRVDPVAARSFLNADLIGWMLTSTLQAYRLGFSIGSLKSDAQPEPTPEPSDGKTTDSASSSRRSRARSSSR